MISRYAYASNKAISETSARYGTTADGVLANSFQHAFWSSIIIREAMYVSYSKNNAILFTRDITSDHECDSSGNRQYTSHTAMDLYNNMQSRSWFGNNSSGSVWPFLNVPSESYISDIFYNMTRYKICNAVVNIPAMYNWNFLYGEARGLAGDELFFISPEC